jgi:hypothetical protein
MAIHQCQALRRVWRSSGIRAIVGQEHKGLFMVVAELAAMAGAALVQAMVTDGWEGVRHRVARLFGRGEPDPAIGRRLDASREQLAGVSPAELGSAQANLAAQWQTRFEDLLADHPDAQAELVALVEEMQPVITSAADHSGAAGRDMKASADHGSAAANVVHGHIVVGPTMPGPTSG